MLGGDDDFVSDQETGVETHTELTNHVGHFLGRSSILHLAQEVGSAGFGDGTEVSDQVILGHT